MRADTRSLHFLRRRAGTVGAIAGAGLSGAACCKCVVALVDFEELEDWEHESSRSVDALRMKAAEMHWHPRRYHKWPSVLATVYDILVGIVTGLWLIVRHRIGFEHARSYVAAVIASVFKRLARVRFIFDMRGLWADERVDGGLWPRDGRMFRAAKWFERRFFAAKGHS